MPSIRSAVAGCSAACHPSFDFDLTSEKYRSALEGKTELFLSRTQELIYMLGVCLWLSKPERSSVNADAHQAWAKVEFFLRSAAVILVRLFSACARA